MEADTKWRRAVAEAPRELFIPELIWVDDDRVGGYVTVSRSDDPGRWWELVAADAAVVTQVDDGRTPPGSVGRSPSSSCPEPSMLLRLRVTGEKTAEGRFGGNLAFMRLRTQRGPAWVDNEDLDGAETTTSTLSSAEIGQAVDSLDGSFAVGLHLPDCRVHVEEDAAGNQHVVWLRDRRSLARVVVDVGGSAHDVRQTRSSSALGRSRKRLRLVA